MAKKSNRNDWGVMELAREKPLAATAVAAGAAAAGLFLWSRRAQISEQLSGLSDQIGEWTDGMRGSDFGAGDDTGGLTTGSSSTRGRTTTRSRSSGGGRTGTSSSRGQAQSGPTT